MLALYVAGALAAILMLWAAYTYNLLVRARNKVEEALSGIDVQLKNRHDLVPNLVDVVAAYARHESALLGRVAEARSQAHAARSPSELAATEHELVDRMRELVALAEAYPELRASENFTALMRELADVENEIQASRRLYNQNVNFLNTYAQQFPAYLVAGRMADTQYPYLEFERVAEAPPRVGQEFAA